MRELDARATEIHDRRIMRTSLMRESFSVTALGVLTIIGSALACAAASSANSSETAALVGLISMIVGLAITFTFRKPVRPLSFYSLYAYSHAALFVFRPAYNGLFQNAVDPFGVGAHDSSIVAAAAVAGVGFVCASAAYGYVRAAPERTPVPAVYALQERDWRNLFPLLLVVVASGVALYSVYVRQVGGIARLIEVSSGRSVQLTESLASSSGYFTSGLLFTLGASVVIYSQGLVKRRRVMVFAGILLLVIGSGPQLLSGSRSVFIPVATTLLVCFVWTFPGRIRPWQAFVTAIPAFLLLFIVPRLLRQVSPDSASLRLSDELSPGRVFEGFFGGLDTAMLDAFAHQVAAQAAGQLPMSYGSTYVGALGAVIPRAWWAQKPETVDNLLNQALFPVTAAKSIGFSFSIYSEPFLNFGLIGVLVFCVVLGAFLALLDNFMCRPMSSVLIAISALGMGTVFPVVRGSVTFDVQRFIIPAAPVLLAVLIVKLLSRRNPAPDGKNLVESY